MAVVGTAARGVIIYQLENQPQEFKRMESPLKYQVSAVTHLYTHARCLGRHHVVNTCEVKAGMV